MYQMIGEEGNTYLPIKYNIKIICVVQCIRGHATECLSYQQKDNVII